MVPSGEHPERGAPAIVVRDLVKKYGSLAAVDGVSLEVRHGEFFGILGPNGAGKTTCLELIEGLRQADGGDIEVLGMRPWPRNPKLLPRLGVQLQASAFFEKLTAREQLRTFGDLYGVTPSRVDEVLEAVGLMDKADARDTELSGGQRQRLSIATALLHGPEILFLDEPTAALDPQARRNLWDVLRTIQAGGTTVLYTTHYLDEAQILCDRVAIMDQGKILALDTPNALVRDLRAATRVSLPAGVLSAAEARNLPGADSVEETEGEVTISTADPTRLVGSLAANDRLHGITVRTATLEDVFLQLTGREYRA